MMRSDKQGPYETAHHLESRKGQMEIKELLV